MDRNRGLSRQDAQGRRDGVEDGKKETYSTESLAKFAFSIFWRAMKFAKENRTPVLFDY